MQKVGKEITFDILPEKLYVKDKYKRIRIKYYLKDEGEYSFIQKQVCWIYNLDFIYFSHT